MNASSIDSPLLFSVVICTRNRADSLERTLDSLVRQTLPDDTYEVIVVDNASTDSTRVVVAEWEKRFNNVRYVLEPNLGLNRARNRGWREAKGRWVAYIDDDAVATPSWLAGWFAVTQDIGIDIQFGGGPVYPDWGRGAPSWVPTKLSGIYTVIDHGNQARVLLPDETILGTNMFFQRNLLISDGGFDDLLGRAGEGLSTYGGDEAEYVARLRAKGLSPYYQPQSIVRHRISSDRKRRSWFLRRMYMDGKTQVILDARNQNVQIYNWRRVAFDLRNALCAVGRAVFAATKAESEIFYWLGIAAQRLGRATEELRGLNKS